MLGGCCGFGLTWGLGGICCWSWCVVGGVRIVDVEVYSGHAGTGCNAYPGWNASIVVDGSPDA